MNNIAFYQFGTGNLFKPINMRFSWANASPIAGANLNKITIKIECFVNDTVATELLIFDWLLSNTIVMQSNQLAVNLRNKTADYSRPTFYNGNIDVLIDNFDVKKYKWLKQVTLIVNDSNFNKSTSKTIQTINWSGNFFDGGITPLIAEKRYSAENNNYVEVAILFPKGTYDTKNLIKTNDNFTQLSTQYDLVIR